MFRAYAVRKRLLLTQRTAGKNVVSVKVTCAHAGTAPVIIGAAGADAAERVGEHHLAALQDGGQRPQGLGEKGARRAAGRKRRSPGDGRSRAARSPVCCPLRQERQSQAHANPHRGRCSRPGWRSVTLLPLCRTSNSLGHARIGVVAGSRRHLYSRARVDGFRAVAEAAAASEAVISVAHGNWDREKAEAVTHSLFDADPAITAVFACSDTMALGVYDALAARALRIPADVSVVGFDDRPEAQWARPSLTTVRQPTAEMGATAVKRLLEIARTDRNGLKSPPRLEVSAELVIRESTSQAPKYQRPPAKDQLGPAAW